MNRVIIGMDPHKRSATIEIMAGDEAILGGWAHATGAAGYRVPGDAYEGEALARADLGD
jgi:hypothetical protein